MSDIQERITRIAAEAQQRADVAGTQAAWQEGRAHGLREAAAITAASRDADPFESEDTIAIVMIDGQRYEISWPPDAKDPDQRSPWAAVIYSPGGELVDFLEPSELDGFRHESEVIIAAMEWLAPEREDPEESDDE